MGSISKWAALVADKQAQRNSKIPEEWRLPKHILNDVFEKSEASALELLTKYGLLIEREREITERYNAATLAQMLATGAITSQEVCTAFCKRAAIAHQLTNCGTEIFFDKALERAKFLDDYLAREQKPFGPFHGLPISIKDSFNVKGLASTLGYVKFLENPVATENSTLVDILLDNGAVLYLKTNVPQTLMTCDSINNVFGRTLNPHKLSLTAGGSSGGEGALVGFRGSLLGVGTDVGGSIRIPALCCGVYGFKPTADRVPYGKQEEGSRPGDPGVVSVAGPLATSAADLSFFFRNVLKSEPWQRDATALAVPWRDLPKKDVLTIGVLLSDPDYPVKPPITRAMQSAINKLRDSGHKVEILSGFPSVKEAATFGCRFYMLDNKHTGIQLALDGGEAPIAALGYANPTLLAEDRDSTLDDVWDSYAARSVYQQRLFDLWQEKRLDVLLCPAAASTAAAHDTFGMPVYTVIWNLFDFPAATLPYLCADKFLDSSLVDGYDPESVDSAPCGFQIVGWRFQDEEVLRATEIIADVLAR